MNARLTFMTAGALVLLVAVGGARADSLERLKYNHPGLHVDLGVGLWAWPLPMDFDGDGDPAVLILESGEAMGRAR